MIMIRKHRWMFLGLIRTYSNVRIENGQNAALVKYM